MRPPGQGRGRQCVFQASSRRRGDQLVPVHARASSSCPRDRARAGSAFRVRPSGRLFAGQSATTQSSSSPAAVFERRFASDHQPPCPITPRGAAYRRSSAYPPRADWLDRAHNRDDGAPGVEWNRHRHPQVLPLLDSSSVNTTSVGRKGRDGSCQNRLREDPCISRTSDGAAL